MIVLDGVHERTLATNVLFGCLKEVRKMTPGLKLIVMSSIFEAEKFEAYMSGGSRRLHPVEIFYMQEPGRDYLEAAIGTIVQIYMCQPPGDILICSLLVKRRFIMPVGILLKKLKAWALDRIGPVQIMPLYYLLPLAKWQCS